MLGIGREQRDSLGSSFARHRLLARCVAVAALGAAQAGCGKPVGEVGVDTSEGEAVVAALEHVAAVKWVQTETTLVAGRAAVAYRGPSPLSEAPRGFLDEAFEARGWRWSTEDPLVPTGNCFFPDGDCRLKDPTELHLTFSVERVQAEDAYRIDVDWLGSFRWRGTDQAELGGEGMIVTPGSDGWVVEVRIR